MTRTLHTVESLVPSWLLHDASYRTALSVYLSEKITRTGEEIVAPVRIAAAESEVAPPIGMILLRAQAETEDFDVEVGED